MKTYWFLKNPNKVLNIQYNYRMLINFLFGQTLGYYLTFVWQWLLKDYTGGRKSEFQSSLSPWRSVYCRVLVFLISKAFHTFVCYTLHSALDCAATLCSLESKGDVLPANASKP